MDPFLNTMTWSSRFLSAAEDALRVIAQFIPVNTLFVALNDNRTSAVLRAVNRNEQLVAEETVLPLEETYCRLVTANRTQPTVIPDTAVDPETRQLGVTQALGSCSFIGVPITLGDPHGIVGTICALSNEPYAYTSREADLLLAMAELLAHVIELELAAVTDPMTGLYNRAYLELLQSQTKGIRCPYGVLFLDIDNFKRVNDRFGHAAGDAVLRVCAAAIREAAPGGTHIRLHGDEFLVLLQDISAAELQTVAARMETRLSRLAAEYEPGQSVSASASVGAAHASDLDADLEALIRQADSRMYQAKAAAKVAAYELEDGGGAAGEGEGA